MKKIEKEAIKISFKRIKKEMFFLKEEINFLKNQLSKTNHSLNYLNVHLNHHLIKTKEPSTSTINIQQIDKNPAQNISYNEDLSHKSTISIGNEGVPADSQQTVNRQILEENQGKSVEQENREKQDINLDKLSLILEDLKKELRQKFKNLTNQELLIFSLIYTLNEELSEVSYKDIALKANLTESSVRDYISRLEHKGIPLIKEKKNNKRIILKIPDELKHISTLDNLTKLSKNN